MTLVGKLCVGDNRSQGTSYKRHKVERFREQRWTTGKCDAMERVHVGEHNMTRKEEIMVTVIKHEIRRTV